MDGYYENKAAKATWTIGATVGLEHPTRRWSDPWPLYLLLLLGFLSGCGNSPSAPGAPAEEEMTDHDQAREDGYGEGPKLSPEQMTAGDMVLGLAEMRAFNRRVRAAGKVHIPPEYEAEISAYYPGYVKQLKLIPGDKVRRGAQLFRVENPELFGLQQSLLETKLDTAQLSSEALRLEQLAAENIAAKKDAIAARAALSRAQAKLAGLTRQLAIIGIDPEKVEADNFVTSIAVRAPFSGYVTEVYAATGKYLSPEDAALEFISTDHLHLELEVFEKDIVRLKEEQAVQFWLPSQPGETGAAIIHRIGKRIEETQRTVHVHADPQPGKLSQLLLPGMFVEAEILTGQGTEKIAVPEEAVVKLEGMEYLLVVSEQEGDILHFRQEVVRSGLTQDGWTEILEGPGLTTKSRVLIRGAHKLVGVGSAHAH
jgi:cobalt-zinc-cadmium efflux system membrane fusion protein